MASVVLSDEEFGHFRRWLHQVAGISLSDAKKQLVTGRLAKRLQLHGLASYGAYYRMLTGGRHPDELRTAVDLLTTNETYFFREPKHFEFLRGRILPGVRPGRTFRVWSAASSSGQEAYSIAMVLADRLGDRPWEVVGSDLSSRVLDKARAGHYPLEQASHIPQDYLRRFCLKGTGAQAGTFLVDKPIRGRVGFRQANLIEPLPNLGEFDLIFLRNVMIYFDADTKRSVVSRLAALLRPGGHLFIGHSESLNGISAEVKAVMPAIYRKDPR
jgi:chemotaxis protein methyltransferase CheR